MAQGLGPPPTRPGVAPAFTDEPLASPLQQPTGHTFIDEPLTPPGQWLGDPTTPSSMHATTWSDRIRPYIPTRETLEGTLPYIGATIGGVAGGIPGAALGAAGGESYKHLLEMQRTGKPPERPPLTKALMGSAATPPSTQESPVVAGLKESGKQALGLVESGVEKGALPEAGGRALSSVVRGPLRPPAGPPTRLMQVNQDLKLGLTAAELAGDTPRGVLASQAQQLSERSLTGRMVSVVKQQAGRQNAIKGVATGGEALSRVGQALGDTVAHGPAYDMLPHQMEAARIFGEEIAPKLLDLKGRTLPQQVTAQLQAAAATPGGLSPALALRAIRATKAAIQKGSKEAIPVGSLDALEKVLSTKESIDFGSGTALRTGLIETGKQGDALLKERGAALTRKFTGDLTQGMSKAYPEWDPLRTLYAQGAQGLKTPAVKQLMAKATPEELAAGKSAAATLPRGTTPPPGPQGVSPAESTAIENLRYISDALNRRKTDPQSWTRLYNAFEVASVMGAGIAKGPGAAAKTALVVEGIPGMIAWAAHNPTMTKLLTQGITAKDPAAMTAALTRVYQAYREAQGTQPAASPPPGR